MRNINRLVVHCAYTKHDMDIGVSEIKEWHKARGFRTIGYHIVIRRDGSIEFGRPLEEKGAHAKGFNADSVGVCLVGGMSDSGGAEFNFTESQMKTLGRVIDGLQTIFEIPTDHIVGHRDLPHVHKECPCFDVEQWLDNRG